MNTTIAPSSPLTPAAEASGAAAPARRGLRRLSRLEQGILLLGHVAAAGLLFALVQTCEVAVHNGDRLRAEQQRLARMPASMPMEAEALQLSQRPGAPRSMLIETVIEASSEAAAPTPVLHTASVRGLAPIGL